MSFWGRGSYGQKLVMRTPGIVFAAPLVATAIGTTVNPTRTLGSFAVVPQMTVTIVSPSAVAVRVTFECTFSLLNNDDFDFAIFVDGVQQTPPHNLEFHATTGILGLVPGAIDGVIGSAQARVSALAGSHTYDVRWRANAGTARAVGTERRILAVEDF